MTPARGRGSLVVAGVGIGGPPQTTLETVAAIERADVVFYLVMDPTTECWLRSLNVNAESLQDLYGATIPRHQTYRRMVDRIVTAVRTGQRVCAVFYGHPGVLVTPGHAAIARARRLGHDARMLPGVSVDACLYAELGVDPGQAGVQSFETTDFLLFRKRVDATAALLLWQVGVIGESTAGRRGREERRARTGVLVARLLRDYPASHRVVLYEAATFAGARSWVRRVPLAKLAAVDIRPVMTLLVPPLPPRATSARVRDWLRPASS